MKILIQGAAIVDRQSPHHAQIRDIIVENGFIKAIGTGLSAEDAKVVQIPGLHVSPGWVDIFSHFCDPGYEHKETLETGAAAAAAGGFTDVFVLPNTRPVVDAKSQVEYIRFKSAGQAVNIWPIGAMTRGGEGKDLAEMYDMRNSGAVAFSDGIHPVQSAGLLLKGLQYVKAFDGVIIQVPDDKSIGANGLMNEGIVSTRLGLPGKPMMAEELIVARDIKLARYTDSRLHFTGISSPKSLDYILRAKASGLQITCSVAPYHLFFTDADLTEYDTNLKVFPPLRDRSSMEKLRAAVLDGTVDCIASHHQPHEYDSKILEFEYAKPGMIGLETAYAAVLTAIPQLTAEKTVDLFCDQPRRIFGMERPTLNEGAPARLTLFNPAGQTVVDAASQQSKSVNTAFAGKTLTGSVEGILSGSKLVLNQNLVLS